MITEARTLRETLDELVREPGFRLRAASSNARDTLVASTETAIEEVDEDPFTERFSPFDDVQMARAAGLMSGLETLVDGLREDGKIDGEALSVHLTEWMGKEPDKGTFRYALLLLRTHNPDIKSVGPIEPLARRAPRHLPGTAAASGPERLATNGETRLAWFRNDPSLSEHHEQWHLVYPHRGLPPNAQSGLGAFKDRQGEVFFYMHQQMLARYDTERLAEGLDPIIPLDDYDAPIAESCDPAELEGLPEKYREFGGARKANARLSEYPGSIEHLKAMKRARKQLTAIVKAGRVDNYYGDKNPLGIDGLGAMLEPGDPRLGPRINLHNAGHRAISLAVEPEPPDQVGVMADTDTSMRDPVF